MFIKINAIIDLGIYQKSATLLRFYIIKLKINQIKLN